jgi:hypothetical protein
MPSILRAHEHLSDPNVQLAGLGAGARAMQHGVNQFEGALLLLVIGLVLLALMPSALDIDFARDAAATAEAVEQMTPGLVRPEGQPTATGRAETRSGSGHGLGPRWDVR